MEFLCLDSLCLSLSRVLTDFCVSTYRSLTSLNELVNGPKYTLNWNVELACVQSRSLLLLPLLPFYVFALQIDIMRFELLIEHPLFVLLLAVTVIALVSRHSRIAIQSNFSLTQNLSISSQFLYQRSSPFPGPPSLPIIGSTPWLPSGAFTELVKSSWKEKYGPIFRVDFGMTRMFVICDAKTAKEILGSNSIHLGGRPDIFFFQHELGLEEK